ncbi:unconventional myosin-XVIIIa isoform X13 [Penaeus vannamei]|uniref:unconventional myosin-XVIIIa isoform X13 n=1 Tax=Penaeus vannamei TaxID=6689 RepID=UPI00387F7427
MEASASPEIDVGDEEASWKGSGDALLAAFESLLREIGPAAEEPQQQKAKWSSEELLASCQALLDDTRDAVLAFDVPSPTTEQRPDQWPGQRARASLQSPAESPDPLISAGRSHSRDFQGDRDQDAKLVSPSRCSHELGPAELPGDHGKSFSGRTTSPPRTLPLQARMQLSTESLAGGGSIESVGLPADPCETATFRNSPPRSEPLDPQATSHVRTTVADAAGSAAPLVVSGADAVPAVGEAHSAAAAPTEVSPTHLAQAHHTSSTSVDADLRSGGSSRSCTMPHLAPPLTLRASPFDNARVTAAAATVKSQGTATAGNMCLIISTCATHSQDDPVAPGDILTAPSNSQGTSPTTIPSPTPLLASEDSQVNGSTPVTSQITPVGSGKSQAAGNRCQALMDLPENLGVSNTARNPGVDNPARGDSRVTLTSSDSLQINSTASDNSGIDITARNISPVNMTSTHISEVNMTAGDRSRVSLGEAGCLRRVQAGESNESAPCGDHEKGLVRDAAMAGVSAGPPMGNLGSSALNFPSFEVALPHLAEPLEPLLSDTDEEDSLLSYETCSSGGDDSCGGAWCSCCESNATDGELGTDAGSEYSLGSFTASCEALWQWNPSYDEEDREVDDQREGMGGQEESDTGTVASRVLAWRPDRLSCQERGVGDGRNESGGSHLNQDLSPGDRHLRRARRRSISGARERHDPLCLGTSPAVQHGLGFAAGDSPFVTGAPRMHDALDTPCDPAGARVGRVPASAAQHGLPPRVTVPARGPASSPSRRGEDAQDGVSGAARGKDECVASVPDQLRRQREVPVLAAVPSLDRDIDRACRDPPGGRAGGDSPHHEDSDEDMADIFGDTLCTVKRSNRKRVTVIECERHPPSLDDPLAPGYAQGAGKHSGFSGGENSSGSPKCGGVQCYTECCEQGSTLPCPQKEAVRFTQFNIRSLSENDNKCSAQQNRSCTKESEECCTRENKGAVDHRDESERVIFRDPDLNLCCARSKAHHCRASDESAMLKECKSAALAGGATCGDAEGAERQDVDARSEEQVAAARAWLDAERVWLVHRGGFCAARQLRETDSGEPLPEGRVRLKLEHNGDIIEVDEDDVEKANPPPYDRCEDLAQLRYLNESSVLHTLRQRYGSNLIHTYAGAAMVVINPTSPLAIYSEKVIQMFKGCKLEDMPPHIYSAAQASYRDLLATRRDQSIVFLGRSGAGKTTNFRHVLHYLALAAGATNKILTVEKLNAISTLLEAFGNSRTVMNTNATRFTQIFSLDFDHSGQIASASVQVYMPEKTRVVRRPEGEPNYHIFYQLLSGADDDLRRTLGLDRLTEPNLFMTPLQRSEDKQKAGIAWARIRAALDVLGVSPDEQHAIWSVLAAIYHLGTAGAVRAATGNKFQFSKPGSAQRAATLLGTSVEELARSIFYSTPSTPSTRASFSVLSETFDEIIDMIQQAGDGDRYSVTASPTERPAERPEGLEALEGMAAGLYSEAFNAIVALINRCISTSAHTSNSILVVDAPGFQNPASCGRTSGATFQDLCHNYTQERFQMLFHDTTFTAQTDRYAQEHIEYGDVGDEIGTPAPLIALIDKASSNCVVRTSQVDLKEADRRGLLWLLDEEAIFPGASDQSFLERLYAHYGSREYSQLLKKGQAPDQFTLQHFQGTNPVTYSILNWLKSSRENPVMRQAAALLQESNKETLSRLFVFSRGPVSNTISGSVVGIEGSQSLRRASSIRRAFTTGTAGIKRKSVCLQVKFTVDGIVETLRRSKLRFVHCLLPQHNAGLCDLKSSLVMPNKTNNSSEDILLNVPLVRSQLRGCQILDALRLHKQGFPEHIQYSEFRRRFAVLAPAEARAQAPVLDERAAVEAILAHLDLDSSSYRLGLSQIFFRTGAISRLEEQRDLVLTDTITNFQAHCRGYLARKRLEKRKVQETAIRCIQKNVRKFMGVRDWPWWRLLVRVTPLLNVHRTEEELRATKDELETLRARLDKVEKERGQLKHDNDRLEARLSEVAADLSEEHTTAHLAGERLEAEQAERMKLEKELDRLQTDVRRMTTENGKLEMEKLALRTEVLSAADLNGDADDDDYGEEASLYKRKYEWCLREIEVLKKQLKQQQEDDYDQLVLMKKQLEKKVADAYEETDEQRQVVAQMKRKCQRLQAEMNDLKILLEEQTSRNNLLEKKQRKFDQEMMAVQEELRGERSNKEKIQRERDQILSQKYSFEQEVSTLKLELELKEEKVASLNREIEDLNFTGKTEEEIATLKKAKHDLEMRIKDQEEELDDLAGQVQMLEGAKVRLEMSIEQMRKENRREMAQREEELEEVRIAAQKKVKALEAQLENEHEERTLLVREKHELERRIADLQDRTITHVDEDYVHKLKKELKKTKVLLRDTQTMLEKAQSEGSHKVLVRQLKTQLEDAEFAKTAAIKARQSAESDLSEINSQLEEALRYKNESEDKCARMCKEKAELQTQLEESEEEVAEVMKKYKAVVSQLSVDQITLSEQSQQIAELEHSKQVLQERMLELTSKVEVLEGETANIHTQRRLEMKIKEVESKLELEQTTRQRLESQIGRLKDQIERLTSECDSARLKESQAQDQSKRLGRQLREAKEDLSTLQQRHTDAVNKKNELEKQLELSDSEVITLKSDLKLAFKRIEDLQQAIQGDISDSDSDLSDRLELPNSPCSEAMSAISEDLEEASNKESFA